jgi:hypothetical protein
VLVGSTAARLTFWTDLADDTIQVAEPSRRMERDGWRAQRRRIHPDLVLDVADPVVARVSAPALTAVDLAAGTDGESIDRVLLSRQARLDDLWQALERCAHRRGVRASKRRLIESRAEPWSKAERILHRHLRAAGIRGWRANGEVWINDRQYFPDVGFFALKLAVEVDGRIHLYVRRPSRRTVSGRTPSYWPAGPCCGSPGRTSRSDPTS